MGRGPTIKEEEVIRAQELKTQGITPRQIAERLGRSLPTVYKLLAIPPREQGINK